MTRSATYARLLAAILSGAALLGPAGCSATTTQGTTTDATGRELRRDVRGNDDESSRDGTSGGRGSSLSTRHERDHHNKRR